MKSSTDVERDVKRELEIEKESKEIMERKDRLNNVYGHFVSEAKKLDINGDELNTFKYDLSCFCRAFIWRDFVDRTLKMHFNESKRNGKYNGRR